MHYIQEFHTRNYIDELHTKNTYKTYIQGSCSLLLQKASPSIQQGGMTFQRQKEIP